MAIKADSSYGEKNIHAGQKGLAAARAIGMLTYRGPEGYNLSQQNFEDENDQPHKLHRATTYQRYQGEKLIKRFDAYSYVTILNAFDTHDVGRKRGGLEKALKRLTMPVLLIGITTDIIFTPNEMKKLSLLIPGAIYEEISSPFGHDGFLVEYELLNEKILSFFKKLNLDNSIF